MLSNDIVGIICDSLESNQERIILQALKLLAKLATVEDFRAELFSRGQMFPRLKAISDRAEDFTTYQSEIQTYLCKCLDKITGVDGPSSELVQDGLHGQGGREQQLEQVKIFNKFLIDTALERPYKLQRLDDPEDTDEDALLGQMQPEANDEQQQEAGHLLNGAQAGIGGAGRAEGMSGLLEDGQRDQHQQTAAALATGPVKSSTLGGIPSGSPSREQAGESPHDLHRDGTASAASCQSYTHPQTQAPGGLLGSGSTRTPIPDAPGFVEPVLDDIERLTDSNELVENTVCTLNNIASDVGLHSELIANGLIDVIRKFVELYLSSAKEENDFGVDETTDGIDLSVMAIGSLQLIKAIASLIMKLSQAPQIQMQCLEMGMLEMTQTCLDKFHDYEVQTHLHLALGNFVVSGLNEDNGVVQSEAYRQFCAEIRRRAAQSGCLQRLIEGSEGSHFFRIRRICSEYLSLL